MPVRKIVIPGEPRGKGVTHKCEICGSENEVCRFKGGIRVCSKHYMQLYTHGKIYKDGKKRTTSTFAIDNGVLVIKTAGNVEILADPHDHDLLKNHSWCISKTGYAVANIKGNVVKMHRFLLNFPDGIIDHINGNPLDNRRHNLRITTATVNARNIGAQSNTKSGKIGVSPIAGGKKWRARIMVDRREIRLGHFDKFDDAVYARRTAEMRYFGFYSRG